MTPSTQRTAERKVLEAAFKLARKAKNTFCDVDVTAEMKELLRVVHAFDELFPSSPHA